MKVGTKSVLFGAHCFFIHPWLVALAWWRLYGFPFDPRLWVAFFVHDLGYWGKPNMDGPEGETHVLWGARVMSRLFDRHPGKQKTLPGQRWYPILINFDPDKRWWCGQWGQFCLFHSRFYAKKYDFPFSRLCVADKLATCLEPQWLYLPRVIASGEIYEYMVLAGGKNNSKYKGEPNSKYVAMNIATGSKRDWHRGMTAYMRDWVNEHRDGRADTWTPAPKGGTQCQ